MNTIRQIWPMISCLLLVLLFSTASIHAEEPVPDNDAAKVIAELISEIAPENGISRPPFELSRFIKDIELPEDTKRTLKSLTDAAILRQNRLVNLWTSLSKEALEEYSRHGVQQTAEVEFLRYAFGEQELVPAMKAAREAGLTARVRLADILIQECRFDEGIRELMSIADLLQLTESGPVFHESITGLNDISAVLYARTQLYRLDFDNDVLLGPLLLFANKNLKEKQKAPIFNELEEYLKSKDDSINVIPIMRIFEESSEETDMYGSSVLEVGDTFFDSWIEIELIDEWLLQSFLCEIQLAGESMGNGLDSIGHDKTYDIRFSSLYNGPINFSVFFAERGDIFNDGGWITIDPIKTFSKEFHPLRMNNQVALEDELLTVNTPNEGWYCVQARARYCPALAQYYFPVSDTALFMYANRNMIIVQSLKRSDAQIRSNIPLLLSVNTNHRFISYHGKLMSLDDFRKMRDELTRKTAKPDLSKDLSKMSETEIKQFLEILQATEEKNLLPEPTVESVAFEVETNANGFLAYEYDLSTTTFKYEIDVKKTSPGDAGVSSEYAIDNSFSPIAAIWTDLPGYLPGKTVHFRGVVRLCNDGGLCLPQKLGIGNVQINIRERRYGKDENALVINCPLSDCGGFFFDWKLPDAELGKMEMVLSMPETTVTESAECLLGNIFYVDTMEGGEEPNEDKLIQNDKSNEDRFITKRWMLPRSKDPRTYWNRKRCDDLELQFQNGVSWCETGSSLALNISCKRKTDNPVSAILIVEGNGVLHTEELHITETPKTVKLTPSSSWQPGVRIRAIAFFPNSENKDRNNCLDVVEKTSYLFVPPTDRIASIEMATNKNMYRPGDECNLRIKVLDSKGNPLQDSDVSVSIYSHSLQMRNSSRNQLNLFPAMYKYEPADDQQMAFDNVKRYGFSWNVVFGPKHGYGEIYTNAQQPILFWNYLQSEDDKGPTITISSRFGHRFGGRRHATFRSGTKLLVRYSDNVVWEPFLKTDENGVAEVDFTFPNVSDRWTVEIHTATKDSIFGSTYTNLVTEEKNDTPGD